MTSFFTGLAGAARAATLAATCLLAACSTPPADPRGGFATALARALPFAVGVYGVARSEPAAIGGLPPNSDERGVSTLPYARIGGGFLIDAAGHIVTAAHVVSESDEVIVKLADQRVLRATVIGTDLDTDIALLRIDSAGPVAPPLGRSTTLRPGHWVLSVGEPYGLNRSVAAGIVGGMDRHFGDEPELLFVQTDLALNPGNSGGPLLDAAGDIVGMNLRTVVGAYGAPGVSLSIPIEIVLAIVSELRASGSIVRPRLGAEFDDVSAPVAVARGRSTVQGAMVATVRRGSLAERMGLKVDDIVLALNDRPIAHSADLARALLAWRQQAGTRMVVMRGETLLTLRLD
ncbi:trypsin-like peptidase domain-containing protein [Rhizobacter sp. AJA081-3]|uniref:S1C family serine protease n=1 Tax=Rhizobacter sp. AJA081-3 TaxID=2753607 RepID=UPI001AE0BC2A|nr:trypsin-like peptidase domain-containing protein [Rhizobacter sp. AJA081-3]QTN24088.1 trypsin-like peptidase domain-containing protein [Rhizobacter sp. AJA081-3]